MGRSRTYKIYIFSVICFSLLLLTYKDAGATGASSATRKDTYTTDHSEYKKLTLESSVVPGKRVLVKATMEWTKIPKVRGWDTLHIGWDDSYDFKPILETIIGVQAYKAECIDKDGKMKVVSGEYRYTNKETPNYIDYTIPKEGQRAVQLKFNLKNDWECEGGSFYKVTELTHQLEFILVSYPERNTDYLDAEAVYTHMSYRGGGYTFDRLQLANVVGGAGLNILFKKREKELDPGYYAYNQLKMKE